MDFQVGQSVIVKDGTMAPDDPQLNLSGWQGRIIEITEEENGDVIVGIEWDSITLRGIPNYYLEQCEREGFGWSEYYLGVNDVKPAKSRDSTSEVEEVVDEIESRIGWLYLGDEDKRIQAVLNSATSTDEWDAWSSHLRQELEFPFEAVVNECQDRGPLQTGDRLTVLGIEMEDDLYGIIVQCRQGRKRYDFPLCDLATVNEHSLNAQPIQDYRVWFANR